jgi:hypothetical protein
VLKLLPSLIVINVIIMESSPQAFYRAGSACETGIPRPRASWGPAGQSSDAGNIGPRGGCRNPDKIL